MKAHHHVVNRRYVSTTDPDASIVRQGRAAQSCSTRPTGPLTEAREIITAVEVTPGAVNEGHKMAALIDGHEATTDAQVRTIVADSQWHQENFLLCHDKGMAAHMPAAKYLNEASRKGIFSEDQFVYDKETDTFLCPAGQRLKGGALDERTQSRVYLASRRSCRSCPLKPQCTRARVRSLGATAVRKRLIRCSLRREVTGEPRHYYPSISHGTLLRAKYPLRI